MIGIALLVIMLLAAAVVGVGAVVSDYKPALALNWLIASITLLTASVVGALIYAMWMMINA